MKIVVTILFLLIFAVYFTTTSIYLQSGDSAEITTAALTLGVPHQPGYPFFTIIGHLFSKTPFDVLVMIIKQDQVLEYSNLNIFKVGLASAFFQSLAGVFFYLIVEFLIARLYTVSEKKRTIIAMIGALVYSFSQTIWLYATKPEVFSLNNLFTLSLLYYALKWYFFSSTGKVSKKYLFYFALTFTHHQTIMLFIPSLLILYFQKKNQLGESTVSFIHRWYNLPLSRKFNRLFPYASTLILGLLPYFSLMLIFSSRNPFLNWGQISTPSDVLRALFRVDYGTFGAYLTNTPHTTFPLNQLPFYFGHIQKDLTLYILILAALGFYILLKKNKNVCIVLTTFYLISGPLFIMYANFALDNEFSQATVVRFYMISEIVLLIFSSLLIADVISRLKDLKLTNQADLQIRNIAVFSMLTIYLAIAGWQLFRNKPYYDNLTYQYINTAISQTESDALIMLTGDIPNLTSQYIQAVEGQKKNRIIFSPGQFHLQWFNSQLRSRFPQLIIPPPVQGKKYTTVTQVIDANIKFRSIYISPEFLDIDPQVQDKYLLWPKNLLLKVEQKGTEYNLERYSKEADQIFQTVNIQEFESLRRRKYQLETPIIKYYSRHYYNLAAVFYTVHRYTEAELQLKRSLQIDPEMADSYKLLGNMYYFTPDYPFINPEAAITNYQKYLTVAKDSDLESVIEVKNAISKITQDLQIRFAEQSPATPSGLIKDDATASGSIDGNIKENLN